MTENERIIETAQIAEQAVGMEDLGELKLQEEAILQVRRLVAELAKER